MDRKAREVLPGEIKARIQVRVFPVVEFKRVQDGPSGETGESDVGVADAGVSGVDMSGNDATKANRRTHPIFAQGQTKALGESPCRLELLSKIHLPILVYSCACRE